MTTSPASKSTSGLLSFLDDPNTSILFYSALLALQFGLQPMITTRCTPRGVTKSSIVITIEIFKILISILSMSFESSESLAKIRSKFTIATSLKTAAIPATLYAIQNLCVQYGYTYLDSMTFNLLNQTKTLSAAFWAYILLGQPQSFIQIIALLILVIAAVLLTSSDSGAHAASLTAVDSTLYQVGLIVVGSASFLSGLSGALCQAAFFDPSHHMSSFVMSGELAIYGIIFLVANMYYQKDIPLDEHGNMSFLRLFDHWDMWMFIPVITSALGGIIVGQVTKLAGGVVKGFALIAGIVITGIVQWAFENQPLTVSDFVAIMLVSLAIYLHSNYPVSKKRDTKEKTA